MEFNFHRAAPPQARPGVRGPAGARGEGRRRRLPARAGPPAGARAEVPGFEAGAREVLPREIVRLAQGLVAESGRFEAERSCVR